MWISSVCVRKGSMDGRSTSLFQCPGPPSHGRSFALMTRGRASRRRRSSSRSYASLDMPRRNVRSDTTRPGAGGQSPPTSRADEVRARERHRLRLERDVLLVRKAGLTEHLVAGEVRGERSEEHTSEL